jgi:hypothetical protein
MTEDSGVFDKIDIKLGDSYFNGSQLGVEVVVQQDGAKPHIKRDVLPLIREQGHLGRRNIRIDTQAPQSPDLNVLDLAFNNAIQKTAKHSKYTAANTSEFIDNVKQCFNDYPVEKLVRICALQLVAYREILKINGGNQYDMPHTGIRKRQRQNEALHHEQYEDCADYNISAGLIKSAVTFYEMTANAQFPWNAHPNFVNNDGIRNCEIVPAPYFDVANDTDEADDPSDDRSVESDDEV